MSTPSARVRDGSFELDLRYGELRSLTPDGPAVGWGDGADRASHDVDVSITLPKIPYGGFSPVRLQGQLIKCDLPTRAMRNRERQLPACPPTREPFVITLRTPAPSEEDQALSPGRSRASACRCARGFTSLPQGSLAPARVLLSRTLIAYSDP